MRHINYICLGLILLMIIIGKNALAQKVDEGHATVKLEHPISASYLTKKIRGKSPRLILTPESELEIRRKLQSDPYVVKYYAYLKAEAQRIMQDPLLERELQGFRLLAVSREMVERMSILAMVYRIDKQEEILRRIDKELRAVCAFEDWNPQHFLDVAEMSFAVALAVDWVGDFLPKSTVQLAKMALIEKGILPSYNEGGVRMSWISGSNNWNAVCHGGMIAASLVIADINPELAAKTISRALEKLPNSLAEYAPDGVYPEGPTYWSYGTTYSVIASNALTTALGTDFGISKSPGFMQGPDFVLQTTAPSGELFNFADCGENSPGRFSVLMSWFAAKTGDSLYFDEEFFNNPKNAGRLAGVGLVWLSEFSQEKESKLPSSWFGDGKNPVAVFRGSAEDPHQFYLAAKGGKAHLSHGNMDAGTFVFELDGVRWVIDPGNQEYYPLNKIGFNLAGHCQDCPRWTLLTKKNQGHSTITVNDDRFLVDGQARIIDFQSSDKPEVTIDMTEVYGNHLTSLVRRFLKESNTSIMIEDNFEINDSTKNINWGLMTQAVVQVTKNGAILKQNGKELKMTILEPEGIAISIISLDPPPIEIDKTMENLKRIEIRIPAWTVKEHKGSIKVKLSGE